MCNAVSKPSMAWRGMMTHSLVGHSGSLRLTTRSPSRAIEATFKYRLISLMLVNFSDGLVPCMR